jgi:putative ABC transport system ATP-binding protein
VFIGKVDIAQLDAYGWPGCAAARSVTSSDLQYHQVMTAIENVTLPMIFAGMNGDAASAGHEAAEQVGLDDRRNHNPSSFPAASSSGSLSPGHWRTIRLSSWPTSPPATWT